MRRSSPTVELLVTAVLSAAVGMFPNLIHGDALALCFARALFATIGLGVIVAVKRVRLRIDRADLPSMTLLAVLSAGNWLGFFAAIQVAGASVAVIALFTYPLLTSLIEPVVFRERHDSFEVYAGIAVVLGVCLVVPHLDLGDRVAEGVLFGVGSALAFTFRNLIGRKLVPKYGALTSMFWQFGLGILLFAPVGIGWLPRWTAHDWMLLAIVGALLTSFSQTLYFANLSRVTSSYAALLSCSQPVFTVLMAMVFLQERPGVRTLLGGAVVTGTVIAVALRPRASEAQT